MAKLLEKKPTELQAELQRALEQARATAKLQGAGSEASAAAWDVVEEIEAAIAHSKAHHQSDFEYYCDTHPDAQECRIYDV